MGGIIGRNVSLVDWPAGADFGKLFGLRGMGLKQQINRQMLGIIKIGTFKKKKNMFII